ncbi:hypothetical protein [Microbacterium hatanonis]|jgi:hypothetical protein|uniref:Dinucleotide-utilizing enzyme n=1 Tax=Microbacterium hatanonis TaxID=404366 RepID=A0A5C8I1B8_9MICO|nr:hypothetical protein [Microbacterium hatanonis]TXK12898.1 hypothetical protein FVP77_05465 [Microbacterium hatanonis]
MTSRARLITSIPFWILVAGSVVAGAVGLWIVVDRLGTLERGLVDGTATTAQVYGGQSWSVVGAVLLGAGVVGLLLALALAAAKALIPQGDVAVVETIDWTAEESELEPTPFAAEPAVPAATTAAPVIAEDPDVEVPSTTPAPAAATEGDDKRV